MVDDYLCERCGAYIPLARRKLLPGVRRCVNCSDEQGKTERDLPPEPQSVQVGELGWEDDR